MTSRQNPPAVRAGSRNTIFAESAPRLYRLGYSPVPTAGKQVHIKRWTQLFCDQRPSLTDVEGTHAAGFRGPFVQDGIGLATYDGVIIVDIDVDGPLHDDVYARVRKIVPLVARAPAVQGRCGAKYILRLDTGENPREFNLGSVATGGQLEILAHHRQGVLPPTIHPDTGEPYRYVDDPQRCRLDETHIRDLPPITEQQLREIHAAFSTRVIAARSAAQTEERTARQRQAEAAAKTWDGHPLELQRVAEALLYVDSGPEDHWWRVAAALKNWSGGASAARELFDRWSGGGEYDGIVFQGAPDKFNRTRTQDEAWQQERPAIGIGTIFRLAQDNGYDARLTRWPALKQHRAQRQSIMPVGPFRDAIEAMPKDDRGFHAALASLRAWAINSRRLPPRAVQALCWIIDLVNREHGYAWPSYARLSANTGIAVRDLYKIVSDLEAAGCLIRAKNNCNPDGSRGTAFAVLPAGHDSWDDLIRWHHVCLGHREPTQKISGTPSRQGDPALSSSIQSGPLNGAIRPTPAGADDGKEGSDDPLTTDRINSMAGEETAPSPHTDLITEDIGDLVDHLLSEVDDVRQLIDACGLDSIGRQTVASVRNLLAAAYLGVDGKKPANPDIAVDEEGLRTAIRAASRSAFAPTFEGDRRRHRIDLDLTGGPASRACLQLFRDKLKFALGRQGYMTEGLLRSMQRPTGLADQPSGSAKR